MYAAIITLVIMSFVGVIGVVTYNEPDVKIGESTKCIDGVNYITLNGYHSLAITAKIDSETLMPERCE